MNMATVGDQGNAEKSEEQMLRITDLDQEPLEYLPPIYGFEKMPLVSLEKAVEPLVAIIPCIEAYVYTAKKRCEHPADGLTSDESACIMLYTMEWKPRESSLYLVLNNVLRATDRQEKLEPWYGFLKLFLTALFRLPAITIDVFRGVKFDLSKRYMSKKSIVWWGFSSCTKSLHVLNAEPFLGRTGTRTMFAMKCQSARDISKHSFYPKEDEVLLIAATEFKVVGCLDQGELQIVQLEETIPPVPLLGPLFKVAPALTNPEPGKSSQSHVPKIFEKATWSASGSTVAGGCGRNMGDNQLNSPEGLFIDDNQIMFITDFGNDRIVRWNMNDMNGYVVAGGTGLGSRLDQLNGPTDILVDEDTASLIVSDSGNSRVVRWSLRDNTGKGEILINNIHCRGLAMDNQKCLYVSDTDKHEVRRYEKGETTGTIVAGGHGKGVRLDQLNGPSFIFVDQQQTIYVSDTYNHRVMKWPKDAKQGIVVAGGQGKGHALTQLSHPGGVLVDPLGNLYVADNLNHRVICWRQGATQGTIIAGGNGSGPGLNQFKSLRGLSFDKNGNLYVVDCGNDRIQCFSNEKHR